MSAQLSPFLRAQCQELLDRARTDALELAAAAARRISPRLEWADRVDTAVGAWRPPVRHRMVPLLETFAELNPDPFFVQIGAHDGTQQDPLHELVLEHRWAGIMVEPVPYVFERLSRNYGHLPHIVLENVAVGAEDGAVPFYHLADTADAGRPGLPIWFDALGSLNREVVMAHRRFIPDIDERLVETEVPAITFESLLRRHDVNAIDVLLIDTEGYDYEILKRVDFKRVRPKVIIYESVHLSGDDRRESTARLASFGYDSIDYGMDTWSLNPRALTDAERRAMMPIWEWIVAAERRGGPLAPTRAVRKLVRTLSPAPARAQPDELAQRFPLTDSDRSYLAKGYDERTPLPAGAAETLTQDNARLMQLCRVYAGLNLPAAQHHMWKPERVSQHVQLRYFRGDNLYLWHYPEHPRAMSLTLFVYMRYLESRGGRLLLDRISEDGAFGCWTTEVEGYGKISRDLLDSVNEILFLQRHLEVLDRPGLRMLDIGAGYGRLAHRMATLHPSLGDYCCVDAVPESTFLSEYYLGFRGKMPPARVVPLDEVQSVLKPGSFDLAMNIHSFSECTLAAIQWWLGLVARLEIPHLFVVPNEYEGIISREQDGSWHDALPSFEVAGYRPVVIERVIADPAVRELTRINDNFYLFERFGDGMAPGSPE